MSFKSINPKLVYNMTFKMTEFMLWKLWFTYRQNKDRMPEEICRIGILFILSIKASIKYCRCWPRKQLRFTQ